MVGRPRPVLRTTQVRVLAQGSLGLGRARSCALTAVAVCWATAVAHSEHTVRPRLRAWGSAAPDTAGAKRGGKRREVPVTDCLVPLLRWVLAWGEGHQLALALAATTLGERFVVRAVSVVDRGGALPGGGVLLPAGEPPAWKPEWLRLLRRLRPAIPPPMTVLVLADPGR